MTRLRLHTAGIAIMLLLPIAATAQKFTIKGRITDHNGKPIEIANVSVVGEPVGTIADLNGNVDYLGRNRAFIGLGIFQH